MTRNVMLTEDYLIRQLNLFLAALGRVMGFKTASMYIEAQQEVDKTLEQIFGLSADLVRQMDDAALLDALTFNEILDLDRVQMAAISFREEGELRLARGDAGGGMATLQRALNFYLDVALQNGAWNFPYPSEDIEKLLGKLQSLALDPDLAYGLYLYSERAGKFERAARYLDALLDFPDLQEAVTLERRAFYQRLAAKSDDELSAGGLSRNIVDANLAN